MSDINEIDVNLQRYNSEENFSPPILYRYI